MNLGYWFPDCEHPDEFSKRTYVETHIYNSKDFPLERDSKIPWLLNFYQEFALNDAQQKIPVIALFFSIGIPVWIIFICIIFCFVKKQKNMIAIFLPALFLWLTHMAGPVSNVRYIYPIIAAYPIYAAVLFHKKTDLISSANT